LLEEAKLQRMPKPKPLSGRIAMVTGSARHRQIHCEKICRQGACVIMAIMMHCGWKLLLEFQDL
jgi:hypothetical protein